MTDIDGASPAGGEQEKKVLTLRGATFLGIGSMIGAGIFALLGEAGAVAGAAVWLSFLIGGVVAMLLGYVCVKLGSRYPSSGGLITYLIEGFGKGTAGRRRLVARVHGGDRHRHRDDRGLVRRATRRRCSSANDAASWWHNLFITLIILAMVGAQPRRGEDRRRGAVGDRRRRPRHVRGLHLRDDQGRRTSRHLAFSGYPSFSKILASVALTFFAYLGFNVITFTAGDLVNPKRDLPRAMYVALGVTSVVYILIAIGVFGALTVAAGHPVRGDGDRRGGAAVARGRRLHDHGRRRAALDRGGDERDALRVGEPDRDACRGEAVPGRSSGRPLGSGGMPGS